MTNRSPLPVAVDTQISLATSAPFCSGVRPTHTLSAFVRPLRLPTCDRASEMPPLLTDCRVAHALLYAVTVSGRLHPSNHRINEGQHRAIYIDMDKPTTSRAANKTILIVDDEPDIVDLVKAYLEPEGFHIRTAATGMQALTRVQEDRPDLVILDLMLPDLDGLEVCRIIRTNPATALTAVIMLTAKAAEADTIIGLDAGADDYVTKPFSPKPLVARVKALLRRMDHDREARSFYRYRTIVIDLERHEVTMGNREIALTLKEFRLLERLVHNVGRVLTREVLLNTIWGYDYYGMTRTVDVHIRRLKQKIPLLDGAIVSLKTLGYKLRELDSSH